MGRSDGFQALLDRAAANTIESPPMDRIFRPTAKENWGVNHHRRRNEHYEDGADFADTSSFGTPGHDAPGQWTEDRRKMAARERNFSEEERRESLKWNHTAGQGRSIPLQPPNPRPVATSPTSTPSRSSSSYSNPPAESMHLRYGDTDERFHSPRHHTSRNSPRADVPRHSETRHTRTEAEWKLREAELEVSLQRKEQDFQSQVEKFEQFRQDELNQIDAEYRTLKGMQQDIDSRIELLRRAEKELNEREASLAEEQTATGEAISDLEHQAEQWERQKKDRTHELASLEAQSRTEEIKLTRLQQQLTAFAQESQDKKNELQDDLEFVRSETVAATREQQKLESQLLSDQKLLETLQAKVQEKNQELTSMTEQVKYAEDKLTVVSGQIEVAQRQKRSLDRDLVAAKDCHADLKAETAEMELHLTTEEERWRITEENLKEERSKLETERCEASNRMHDELERQQAAMAEERRKNDGQIASERKAHDERLKRERDELKRLHQEQEQRLAKSKHQHDEQVRNFQERRRRVEKALREEHQRLNDEKKAIATEREQLCLKVQSLGHQKRDAEEKLSSALSDERRQTNKIRQELEACTQENKRLRHEFAQAQQKALLNQQRVKEFSNCLEKQAAILETKSTSLQHERATMEKDLQDRLEVMNQQQAMFRDRQQKYALEALLRRQAEKKASIKAVFSKWVETTACQDVETKLQEAERREYRLKQDFQARQRESREKEKELFTEIETLKNSITHLREREQIVMEGNDRIRLLARQLQEKDMELRAREAQLMHQWIQDEGESIGESTISTNSVVR